MSSDKKGQENKKVCRTNKCKVTEREIKTKRMKILNEKLNTVFSQGCSRLGNSMGF